MEIIERLQSCGGATNFVHDPITGSAVGVNGQMLKLVLLDMLKESGVDIMLHSMVTDVESCEKTLIGVYVQSKLECRFVRAKRFIDCTDGGDLCILAGCHTVLGRESDAKCQIASNVIIYGGIDFKKMLSYFEDNPDQIRPFPMDDITLSALLSQMKTAPIFVIGGFERIIEKAKADGVNYARRQLIGVAYPNNNELMLVASRVEDVDPGSCDSHTRGEIDGLSQTWVILELLQKYIPGCECARIISAGTQLGIREARHVECEYVLTAQDLLTPTAFGDSIAKGAYHLDIHSPDHNGLETCQPPIYSIPYRALIAKGMDNLLVAGRCIGATHEAMSSTRVAPISAAEGQAAGCAAALSAINGVTLRELTAEQLQNVLGAEKAIF